MQLGRLGIRPADVSHIVLTHLDFDHAGGIEDFPWAFVHCMADEHAAATHRNGVVARGRYRPKQWDEVHRWSLYKKADGESWMGFSAVRQLEGLPPDILLVPLIGHTLGHAGVAVRDGSGWFLLAGDAYFHRDELAEPPRCPPGLRAYQRLMEFDRAARLRNQERLRTLDREHHEVTICCSHDVVELESMLAAQPRPRRAHAPAEETVAVL